jgi:uncharacterized protein YuzE
LGCARTTTLRRFASIRQPSSYVLSRYKAADDTIEASPSVFVDVDDAGVPLGIELLFARRLTKTPELSSITVNLVPAGAERAP